ncbi:hypothetical protein JW960_03230 [candidate division KSB1 bacterium]|nr:hypothetical protein [candidate division KSB1 bacterium]
MNTILDIIGATMVGGMLMLIGLHLLDTSTQHFYNNGDDLIVQQNLTGMTHTLEWDLKKMGYGIPEWDSVVLTADSADLIFRSDIDRDNTIDTVHYYVGPLSDMAHTQNPDDRYLYRKVNGLPANGFKVGVVTTFRFDYLNQDGNELDMGIPANLTAVKMVRITLKVENTAVYGNEVNPDKSKYQSAFWQQTRLVSRNLRR